MNLLDNESSFIACYSAKNKFGCKIDVIYYLIKCESIFFIGAQYLNVYFIY